MLAVIGGVERALSENPFSEPGDSEQTVIRPRPGGARMATRPQAEAPPPPSGPAIEATAAGDGPLAMAASPLLTLLARLRNAAAPPDAGDVRERTIRELRAFERKARDAGVPMDQIRPAHYALCAALDDVVLATPWGHDGPWRATPLAQELHGDADAGRGFFEQLRTLRGLMPEGRPVLEIMFCCLSLGMMGPFRDAPDGTTAIERARHHVFELIQSAAPATQAATLAPDAGGIVIPPPARTKVPVWVAGSAALAIVAASYAWSLLGLNAASDDVYRQALASAPAAMPALVRPPATPPPPPPPEAPPGPDSALRAALEGVPDVEVVVSAGAAILRVPAHALFPQPNATLAAGPLLGRIAAALAPVPGAIRVLAYTDNAPARTVNFPSNFALTAARAKAVRTALARTVTNPARIVAAGKADADPIAPNTTPEGRERNRRVDIMVAGAP